ncbi:MAG TPA: LamG domain-containing protein [Gallionella sp.]|nr:LamG domain-containing protein [Gallionella sp.]
MTKMRFMKPVLLTAAAEVVTDTFVATSTRIAPARVTSISEKIWGGGNSTNSDGGVQPVWLSKSLALPGSRLHGNNGVLIMNFENISNWLVRLGVLLAIIGSGAFVDAAQAATLIAEYRMEDAAWNGVAGELKDTAGYTGGPFNGRAIGAPAPSPATASPARAGGTGTCGYASMPGPVGNGGAFSIPNLPVSTVVGAQTSVSFWMYWDGIDSVMPIGWNSHDLWLSGGNFGFNTGNSDIYGIASTGLANSWHHVVAVFTNGNMAGNQLYIDGVAQPLSQRQSTPINGTAVVQGTLQVGGWARDTNYRFGGRLDEVKVYNGALIPGEVNTLYNETHACPVAPPAPVAAWHLDEPSWNGSPGEVADSSGNTLNGTAKAGAGTTSAKICQGGLLSSQSYVEVADSASLRFTSAYSLAAWIRTTKDTGTIVSKTTASSPWPGYVFAIGPNSGGKLALWNGTGNWYVSSGVAVNDGAWHHVAASVNGTSLQFYVDGTPNGAPITLTGVTATATTPLRIGLEHEPGAASRYFSGQIDEVILFNVSLSAAEIATGYANQNAGKDWNGTTRSCSALIAAYHFEGNTAAWNGTAGELKDTAGYSGGPFNGQAIGSPLPAAAAASPARAGGTGTCGYASMPGPTGNGGAFSIAGLPLSPAVGAKTSVSFWMYWDGTDNVMPIGWNQHDLWLVNGHFGFNTFSSDVFGISSSGLANGWHHVVAVFTNGNVAGNQLHIDGVTQILAQRQGSPNNANAYVQPNLRISGSAQSGYRFSGRIDEVRVFSGGMTQAQVASLFNETHGCGAPVAEWHLDELSWNGSPGEVLDSGGNALHGTAKAGAATMSAKVCHGGSLSSQSYVEIADSASLRFTSAYSFAAWIRTTKGSGTIISKTTASSPWPGYVFTVGPDSGGKLALWNGTGSWYVSSGAAVNDGAWHHVVASVNGTSLRFYVDGAPNGAPITLTGVTATATTPLRIGLENEPGTASRFFSGQIDEVILFNASLSAAEVATGYANQNAGKNWSGTTRTCPGGTVIPSHFNCIESGTTANTGHLYTKLAGTAFTFDVAALKADGTVETGYVPDAAKSVTVELGYATDSSCSGWLATSPAISQTLTFSTTDNGRKAAASMVTAKAYPNLRCRVTDANQTPNIIGCSTDNFAIRPTGFTVSSTDAGNFNTTGLPTIKTGAGFNLTAASLPGYDGTPAIDSAPGMIVGTPAQGMLGGSFAAAPAATGTAAGNGFFYSEVGNFGLSANAVFDDIFTGVDQPADCTADFSNTSVAGKYGCKFGSTAVPLTIGSSGFGRFIPDNFDVSYNTPAFGTACGTFGYVGQTLSFTTAPVITVTARQGTANGLTNATTVNYAGAYMKLTSTSLGLAPYDSTAARYSRFDALGGGLTPALDTSGLPSAAADPVIGVFANGVGNLTFDTGTGLLFARSPIIPNAPFNADIALALNVFDADVVAFTGNPASFGTATAGNGIAFSSGNEMRYGRLKLSNAHGSELLDLPVPMVAQLFNGAGFVTNTADSCTIVAVPVLALIPSATAVNRVFNSPFIAGNGGLRLLRPNAKGYVDFTVTAPAWLQYDWNTTTPGLEDPSARATFGVYKGNNEFIYLRETY